MHFNYINLSLLYFIESDKYFNYSSDIYCLCII